jgi:hypothetical protein
MVGYLSKFRFAELRLLWHRGCRVWLEQVHLWRRERGCS